MTKETPVLLLLFNRPDKTRALLSALSVHQPKKLYVGCDGPRNEQEAKRVSAVHAAVAEGVTWPCGVKTLYRVENLGLRAAVSDAITWFFENEPMGIILEDDCLPSSRFFEFTSELLVRYKTDDTVMHISGNNLDVIPAEASYFGSKYPRVWGWATWRRAWSHYSDSDEFLENLTAARMSELYPRAMDRAFWQLIVEKMRLPNSSMKGRSWAYFWALAIRNQQGICLQSTENLIQNVGFGADATNTHSSERLKVLSGEASSDGKELSHPSSLGIFEISDNRFVDRILIDSKISYLKVLLKSFFPFLRPLK